jgi:hypothetical protein
MPTNKLWLEQTERAAWESVEALRQKLLDADKRIERLAPPVEGWPELLATLDAARVQHGLSTSSYAALMRELSERLSELDARSRHAEGELVRERVQRTPAMPAAERPRFESATELPAALMADEDEFESAAGAQFLRALWRRYRGQVRETARVSLDSLVRSIEADVDTLAELDEAEIAEAALALAALAMRLEHEARKQATTT